MINTIGNICIFLALASSLAGMAFAYFGKMAVARKLAYTNFFAMTVAGLGMMVALLTNDFSVSYVAHVGAKETPRFYAVGLYFSICHWRLLLSCSRNSCESISECLSRSRQWSRPQSTSSKPLAYGSASPNALFGICRNECPLFLRDCESCNRRFE